MKLCVSQSLFRAILVNIITRCPTSRLPHHGDSRFFRGALQGEDLFSSLAVSGDWVRKGSYHTAWSVPGDSSWSYSGGAVLHRSSSSCISHGADVLGGTKPLSTSTRCMAWRLAVEELALLQQASGSLHDEA